MAGMLPGWRRCWDAALWSIPGARVEGSPVGPALSPCHFFFQNLSCQCLQQRVQRAAGPGLPSS